MAVELQKVYITERNQAALLLLLVAILAVLVYLVMSRPKLIHLERDENGRLTDIITT